MMKNIYDKVCKQCNDAFAGGPRAMYCPICREERRKESSRKFAAKGRKADRSLGSIDNCIICNNEYIVNAARQKYCHSCAKEQYKLVDNEQGLEYYNQNKDNINLRRSMVRYTERVCQVCGKKFKTKTRSLTCSSECKRLKYNKRMREYNKNKPTAN